jgi:hypothetical protein
VLGSLLLLALAQNPPLPPALELRIGEERRFHVPGIQKIAVSGVTVYNIRVIGRDDIAVSGAGEGRSTILYWLKGGVRLSTALNVVENPPHKRREEVPVTIARAHSRDRQADGGSSPDDLLIVEIPEDLHDVHVVDAMDGGSRWVGTAPDGTLRIITLTPQR